MGEGWLGLAGVLLGFVLGEGSGAIRRRLNTRHKKRTIRAELQSILAQLPQKKEILKKGIAALERKEILPLASVRVVSTGYETLVADVYPHLSALERNCLHVIYERLKVAENFMALFEQDIGNATRAGQIADPWQTYGNLAQDMLASYGVVEDLAKSYLADRPIDVFGVARNAS